VVVVGSILLAFAIDAGWDRRQSGIEEREILGGLEAELVEGLGVVEESRQATVEARGRLEYFLSATPSEITVDSSWSADEVYGPFTRQWHVPPPTGFLDATTGSAKLAVIGDASLRAELALLRARHDHVKQMVELIGTMDAEAAALLGEFEGVSRAAVAPQLGVDRATLVAMRGEARVMGAATAKYNFLGGYLNILDRLRATMESTLELVKLQ